MPQYYNLLNGSFARKHPRKTKAGKAGVGNPKGHQSKPHKYGKQNNTSILSRINISVDFSMLTEILTTK